MRLITGSSKLCTAAIVSLESFEKPLQHALWAAVFALGALVLVFVARSPEPSKLDPRSVGAQIALARLYASRGEKQPAIELAQQAVISAPYNPEAHLALVRAVLASGDMARAEKEVRLLVAQFPKSSVVQVQIGALHLARHDLAAAREAFSRALALDAEVRAEADVA